MSIYKLGFKNSDGNVVALPAAINKFASIEDLKKFAKQNGYDSDKWSDDHDDVLKEVFRHSAIELAEVDNPLDLNWKDFQNAFDKEPGLFPLPWSVFEERIEKGILNGLVDENGKPIATINVMPKLINGIAAHLGIEDEPSKPQVFETGAGWTSETHRGLGIYTDFRRAVLSDEKANNRLIFSQSRGKGASHVNVREGWTLVSFRKNPFSSALVGWKSGDGELGHEFHLSSGLVIKLPSQGIYNGKHINFAPDLDTGNISDEAREFLSKHDWMAFHHLWVNDAEKLERFEKNLYQQLDISEGVSQDVINHTYKTWLKTVKRSLNYDKSNASNNVSNGNSLPSIDWEEFGHEKR